MAKVTTWVQRWGYWIASTPTRPGIWRLREGGFLVRVRVTDPATGKRHSSTRALRDASIVEAQRVHDQLGESHRTRLIEQPKLRPLFATYAALLLERKVGRDKIKSASGRSKWERVVRLHLSPTFGALRVDEIRKADVEAWFASYAPRVRADRLPPEERGNLVALDPQTVNGWATQLGSIMAAAVAEFDLPRNPVDGLERYDQAQHPTYTDEQPNSLLAEEARCFLAAMLWLYPQHYAMTLLGFCTGQRPGHMRPLRRRGPEADILWEEGVILIRRSHSEKQEVMNTTKTKNRQRIGVPRELIDILRYHVESQYSTPEQGKSDLLFPSEVGGYRYNSVLDKPFEKCSREIGLRKRITPRAMRRTYQDLCREASMPDLVTRSISGHQTEEMQRHYSTVGAHEQRAGLGRVLDLVGVPTSALRGERKGET